MRIVDDFPSIRALASILAWLVPAGLLACSSSKDSPDPTSTVTGEVSCDADPARPKDLFDMTDALRKASDGQRDPATVNITLVPNHWSAFWMTPSIGLAVAKREIGCKADMTAAA